MTKALAAWAGYCMLVGVRDLPPDTVKADVVYKGTVVGSALHAGYCPYGRLIPRCTAVYIEAIPGSLNHWLLEVRTKTGKVYADAREVALPNQPRIPNRLEKRRCQQWNQRHALP